MTIGRAVWSTVYASCRRSSPHSMPRGRERWTMVGGSTNCSGPASTSANSRLNRIELIQSATLAPSTPSDCCDFDHSSAYIPSSLSVNSALCTAFRHVSVVAPASHLAAGDCWKRKLTTDRVSSIVGQVCPLRRIGFPSSPVIPSSTADWPPLVVLRTPSACCVLGCQLHREMADLP